MLSLVTTMNAKQVGFAVVKGQGTGEWSTVTDAILKAKLGMGGLGRLSRKSLSSLEVPWYNFLSDIP